MSAAERINHRQHELLQRVLDGTDRHYRTKLNHIRWGRVERDLQAIVLQEIDE